MADCGHNLKLGGAFIDGRNARIAVETFACIVLHKARTTVDLYAVICVLVAVFRSHAFCKRGECVGQLAEMLLFGLLFRFEFALFRDVVVYLVHVHEARASVEKRAGSVKLGLHKRKDFSHSREVDDGLSELAAVLGISKSLTVSGLAETDRLSGYAEARTVHKSHHILYQPHPA